MSTEYGGQEIFLNKCTIIKKWKIKQARQCSKALQSLCMCKIISIKRSWAECLSEAIKTILSHNRSKDWGDALEMWKLLSSQLPQRMTHLYKTVHVLIPAKAPEDYPIP